MSIGIGAMVGAIGGALITGYMGNKAADKQAAAMGDASSMQYAAAMEQLDFEKTQFDWQKKIYADEKAYTDRRRKVVDPFQDRAMARWESIYGPLADNLSGFYKGLTASTFASAGLEELAKTFVENREAITTTLAQRGLGGGALEASLLAQQDIQNAESKATVRRDAPFKVAEAQQGFLAAIGGAPSASAPNNPNAPSGAGVSTAIANIGNAAAAGYNAQAALYGQNANSLYSSAGSLLSTGLNFAVDRFDSPAPVNTPSYSSTATPGNVSYTPSGMFSDIDLSIGANE